MSPKNPELYQQVLQLMQRVKTERNLSALLLALSLDRKYDRADIVLAESTVRLERGWLRKC